MICFTLSFRIEVAQIIEGNAKQYQFILINDIKLIQYQIIHPAYMPPLSLEYLANVIADVSLPVLCQDIHPECSCNHKAMITFARLFKPVLKTYMPIHIVPFLLFKRKRFVKNPLKQLLMLLVGILRSVLFAAGYFCCYKRLHCLFFGQRKIGQRGLQITAALGGLPLIFESRGRQAQIALFGVYKNLQTLYKMGMRRNLPVKIIYGNCVITGIALCIICYHYSNNREVIKESYLNIIDKLLQKC